MSTLPSPPVPYTAQPPVRQLVVVTDVDMTIGAMCRFMVKWVIAAIPAAIILWLTLMVVGLVMAAVFGSLIPKLMYSVSHH
jgi:hypothetical protein